MATSDEKTSALFQPLADYDVPTMPTLDSFQLLWTRLSELFRRRADTPLIADERLQRSTLSLLEEIASPPACGPLIQELESSLAPWLADEQPTGRHRLIVMPPGDQSRVLKAWAATRDAPVLDAPSRAALIESAPGAMDSLEGEGLLVIPALEEWFVRHRNGLVWVRALLSRLENLARPVVVGCNSWAWQFLARSVQADLVLGPPLTFQPFDAKRLHAWFSDIAVSQRLGRVEFLDARHGDPVLATDARGNLHDRLIALAARSRGVPWVAWHLWRHSLRDQAGAIDDEPVTNAASAESDAQLRLWVIALEEFSLPGAHGNDCLLILQALLIHGSLTSAQLGWVLPLVGENHQLSSLIQAGIVERDGDQLYCAPAAYPAIRNGLATAGFPLPLI